MAAFAGFRDAALGDQRGVFTIKLSAIPFSQLRRLLHSLDFTKEADAEKLAIRTPGNGNHLSLSPLGAE